jgi:hypothetical protein
MTIASFSLRTQLGCSTFRQQLSASTSAPARMTVRLILGALFDRDRRITSFLY